jgi:hypothetical protein
MTLFAHSPPERDAWLAHLRALGAAPATTHVSLQRSPPTPHSETTPPPPVATPQAAPISPAPQPDARPPPLATLPQRVDSMGEGDPSVRSPVRSEPEEGGGGAALGTVIEKSIAPGVIGGYAVVQNGPRRAKVIILKTEQDLLASLQRGGSLFKFNYKDGFAFQRHVELSADAARVGWCDENLKRPTSSS